MSDDVLQRRHRPLTIAVCGATGTGKSQLAVEIAQHIRSRDSGKGVAEIISADSMQMYRGLDVITNKVSDEEMGGIKHHMINELDPSLGQECDVTTFVKRAREIQERILANDGVAIVVGGTSYYIQHLLMPGGLVAAERATASGNDGYSDKKNVPFDVEQIFARYGQNLDDERQASVRTFAKTAHLGSDACTLQSLTMWQLLEALDPPMAKRWHFRDHRKVHRSLCVLFETGRRHSDVIAEQKEQQRSRHTSTECDVEAEVEKVVIWLHCDAEALRPRLDARVDKMIDQGLLREIVQLRRIASALQHQTGKPVDHTRGIFQTIGYKEFASYLDFVEVSFDDDGNTTGRPKGDDAEAKRLFEQALIDMKTATRQYAKRQVSWLRNKLLPAVLQASQEQGIRIVMLDGSDLSKWNEKVSRPAAQLIEALLSRQDVPTSIGASLPEYAAHSVATLRTGDQTQQTIAYDVCPVCSSDDIDGEPYMVMRSHWELHKRGRVHRAAMHRRGLLQRREPDRSETAMAKRSARQARQATRMDEQIKSERSK